MCGVAYFSAIQLFLLAHYSLGNLNYISATLDKYFYEWAMPTVVIARASSESEERPPKYFLWIYSIGLGLYTFQTNFGEF